MTNREFERICRLLGIGAWILILAGLALAVISVLAVCT